MKYYIRLDDACEKRNLKSWNRIEELLDQYGIKPLVGIIPHCEDPMMDQYEADGNFWGRVDAWIFKRWSVALHGYNHVCITKVGGVNPVNQRSEFAGVPLDVQREKISNGVAIFRDHGINPKIFFAPSHTFDENTIVALKECSDIRTISDTIANKPYLHDGITYIPQQSGSVRNLPFHTVTFCYHPNTMKDADFENLEIFIKQYRGRFADYEIVETNHKMDLVDRILRKLYFLRRK